MNTKTVKTDGNVPVEKERNAKRGRITNLIKERAQKRRLEEMAAYLKKPAPVAAVPVPVSKPTESTQITLFNLTVSDPRYYISRTILEALNTCDIKNYETIMRKYCVPEVISAHTYVGELEHNPLGPNSRIFVGIDVLVGKYLVLSLLHS